MPNQNVGALATINAASVMTRSKTENRRAAANMPPRKPKPMASTAEAKVRISVLTTRSPNRPATGTW